VQIIRIDSPDLDYYLFSAMLIGCLEHALCSHVVHTSCHCGNRLYSLTEHVKIKIIMRVARAYVVLVQTKYYVD